MSFGLWQNFNKNSPGTNKFRLNKFTRVQIWCNVEGGKTESTFTQEQVG
jgi:hypothetical protein